MKQVGQSIRFLAAALIIVLGMPVSRPVAAAGITPEAALVRVLTAPKIQADWFAPVFLAQVSVAQVGQIRAQVITELGAYRSVTGEGNGAFLVHFQHGTAIAQIHLDGVGRIDGLQVTDLQPAGSSAGGAIPTPQAALARLLSSSVPLSSWFAPSFLAKVSVAQIQQISAGLRESFGAYISVKVAASGTFQAHYRYGVLTGMVHLDKQGRFDQLAFTKAAYNPLSRSAALARFAQPARSGRSSLVLTNDTTTYSRYRSRSPDGGGLGV